MKLTVLIPGEISSTLKKITQSALKNIPVETIYHDFTLQTFKNKKLLFIIQLNEMGTNLELLKFFHTLYQKDPHALKGSTGGILIHSFNELYTKSFAKNIVFLANQLGCTFMGQPLIEATGDLNNFKTWQKTYSLSLEEIAKIRAQKLVKNLLYYETTLIKHPKILALHSSSYKTSNTLMLWNMVKKHLPKQNIKELHVENGTVKDCLGCSFKTCIHYSKQKSCFYGGFMVEEILPSIEQADGIIFLCPNYNDAISANLMAVINRLTSLYRRIPLYDKSLFSIIVSGNSGSDCVAKQLIDALNINKGFRLPSYFTLMATANDPKSVEKVENIHDLSEDFAHHILRETKKTKLPRH